jgi:hypothetical protein
MPPIPSAYLAEIVMRRPARLAATTAGGAHMTGEEYSK